MMVTATMNIEATARVSWSGWSGTVSGASGALTARTATQVELGGPGGGTNPEELLAAALANCYTSTLTSLARARDVDLDAVETSARTHLSWSEDRPHHIARGDLAVRITALAPEQQIIALANDARDHCPVCNVLAATADLTLAITVAKAGSRTGV